jgi:hypothetical protein
MNLDFRATDILALHDACLARADWPSPADAAGMSPAMREIAATMPAGPLAQAWSWVLVNHHFNCSLWNEEDLARRTQAGDAEIAGNKRNIDRFNQARNDAMERIDDTLLKLAADWPREASARASSETAGAMIDRLSILSLKVHHMGLQTTRTDVDQAHRDNAIARQATLSQQRADLAACFDRLLDEMAAGTGFFRIYRQFKMYNDPNLNPALVAERQGRSGG